MMRELVVSKKVSFSIIRTYKHNDSSSIYEMKIMLLCDGCHIVTVCCCMLLVDFVVVLLLNNYYNKYIYIRQTDINY